MNWNNTENGIKATLKFENQTTLAAFVLKLAKISDATQHHADMDIRYNQLHLNIFTHDVNAVTEKDEALCREIEKLLNK
ncbi:4a-hydroxytetrahydrobiopterin dehydratase [Crocinitomicaceae bacterium]|nr:4a-hydroxytetrahydrobiopterin dehydratase [Crocinitomicaceae bacterium]MDC0257570.1 4a-hydroxytetrahydrobiopterin dehydratase [Crocinitomicaceae bacterium]